MQRVRIHCCRCCPRVAAFAVGFVVRRIVRFRLRRIAKQELQRSTSHPSNDSSISFRNSSPLSHRCNRPRSLCSQPPPPLKLCHQRFCLLCCHRPLRQAARCAHLPRKSDSADTCLFVRKNGGSRRTEMNRSRTLLSVHQVGSCANFCFCSSVIFCARTNNQPRAKARASAPRRVRGRRRGFWSEFRRSAPSPSDSADRGASCS